VTEPGQGAIKTVSLPAADCYPPLLLLLLLLLLSPVTRCLVLTWS
jgi:hypothetical protein